MLRQHPALRTLASVISASIISNSNNSIKISIISLNFQIVTININTTIFYIKFCINSCKIYTCKFPFLNCFTCFVWNSNSSKLTSY